MTFHLPASVKPVAGKMEVGAFLGCLSLSSISSDRRPAGMIASKWTDDLGGRLKLPVGTLAQLTTQLVEIVVDSVHLASVPFTPRNETGLLDFRQRA